MEDIELFNDSARIINNINRKSIISWNTILLLIIICFLIFINVPFNKYNVCVGTIKEENEFYIKIDKTESNFPIKKTDKLYIEYKEYNYKIKEINDNYIVIKLNLEDKYKIDNNMVLVKFKSDKTSIYKILKELIKEELT